MSLDWRFTQIIQDDLLMSRSLIYHISKDLSPPPQIRSHPQVLGIRTQIYLFWGVGGGGAPFNLLHHPIQSRSHCLIALFSFLHSIFHYPESYFFLCFQPGCSQPGCFWLFEQGKSLLCRNESFIAGQLAFHIPGPTWRPERGWSVERKSLWQPHPSFHISQIYDVPTWKMVTAQGQNHQVMGLSSVPFHRNKSSIRTGTSSDLLTAGVHETQTMSGPEQALNAYSLNARRRWGCSFWKRVTGISL